MLCAYADARWLACNPAGNAQSIARLQIAAVRGAAMTSNASATNDAVAELLFKKYWEKPPLLTSASTAQTPENIFRGTDCFPKSSFPNWVLSDSESSIRIPFLSVVSISRLRDLGHPNVLLPGELLVWDIHLSKATWGGPVNRCDYLRNMWFDKAPPSPPQDNYRNLPTR